MRLHIVFRKKAHDIILVHDILNIHYSHPQISAAENENERVDNTEQEDNTEASNKH